MARRGQIDFKIEGMDRIVNDFKELGKVPQAVVNKAAREGGKIALKAAKSNAPVGETGNLRKGIILKPEKRTKLGKKSFQVTFNPDMNAIFQKWTKDGTRRIGGKRKDANKRKAGNYYYPASQEWGFQKPYGTGFVPGYHYLKKAIDENKSSIEKAVLDSLGKGIDKALRG